MVASGHEQRKLANHHQEPWKRPLPDFIAALYVKRFGKPIPAVVKTIEEIAAAALAKKRAKKTRKLIASQPPNDRLGSANGVKKGCRTRLYREIAMTAACATSGS